MRRIEIEIFHSRDDDDESLVDDLRVLQTQVDINLGGRTSFARRSSTRPYTAYLSVGVSEEMAMIARCVDREKFEWEMFRSTEGIRHRLRVDLIEWRVI
jgi:hypothetical protein